MWQGIKSKEEAVISHAKQWHWGQSFRMLNLGTPLASPGKQVAPRRKNPLDICRHFHTKGAVDWSAVPHGCVCTAGHGVQLGGRASLQQNGAAGCKSSSAELSLVLAVTALHQPLVRLRTGSSPADLAELPMPVGSTTSPCALSSPLPLLWPSRLLEAEDFGSHASDLSNSISSMSLWFLCCSAQPQLLQGEMSFYQVCPRLFPRCQQLAQ